MDYILLLDDTNFNKDRQSTVLNDRKISVCGFLLPVNQLDILLNDLFYDISILKQNYGLDEFHFTHIFNRKGDYVNLTSEDVLQMIEDFADIVQEYDLKIITQSISAEFEKQQPALFKSLDIICKGLHLNDNKDEANAILLNIIMAKKYLEEQNKHNRIIDVVCDEGLRKNGAEERISGLYYYDLPLHFHSSKENPLLQVADFCAWAKTRVELTLDKSQGKNMKEFDISVLSILEPIQKNYVNLQLAQTDITKGINFDETYSKLNETNK